jgi:NADPH2:quinone reductase
MRTAVHSLVCRQFGPVADVGWERTERVALSPLNVRVDLRAASVGYMDSLMVRGLYQLKPELPYVPGACGAGIVTETGSRVRNIRPGDRVSFLNYFGAFSEEVVTSASSVVTLPASMDFEQGAAYRLTYNPAFYGLVKRGRLRRGENLVVTGASGGVGAAAVQLGRRMGARVIAVVSSAAKAEVATENGASEVVIYGDEPLRARIRGLTQGRGADVLLDVIGGDVLDELTHCVAPYGRILIMGFTSGRIPQIPANIILLKSASVVGVYFGAWGIGHNQAEVRRLNRELYSLGEDGSLSVRIGQRLPLRLGAEALATVTERQIIGKIVLTNEEGLSP